MDEDWAPVTNSGSAIGGPRPSPSTNGALYSDLRGPPRLATRQPHRQQPLPEPMGLLHRLIVDQSPAVASTGEAGRSSPEPITTRWLPEEQEAATVLDRGTLTVVASHSAAFS